MKKFFDAFQLSKIFSLGCCLNTKWEIAVLWLIKMEYSVRTIIIKKLKGRHVLLKSVL